MAFRFQPGFISQRTAIALNELAQIVEKLEPLLRRQGESAERTQERFVVKITAVDGSGAYSGTEQGYTTSGAYEDLPNGRVFSPSDKPITERNSRVLSVFPVYYEVSLKQLVDGTPTYEFDAGSAGINFQGHSGTDQALGVTTLRMYHGVIAEITPGNATYTPSIASESLSGIIDYSPSQIQIVSGDDDAIPARGGHLGCYNGWSSRRFYVWASGKSMSSGSDYAAGSLSATGEASEAAASILIGVSGDGGTGGSIVSYARAVRDNAGSDTPGGTTAPTVGFDLVSTTKQPAYGCWHNSAGAMRYGATGTSGGGDTVVGGLITVAGTASTLLDMGTW